MALQTCLQCSLLLPKTGLSRKETGRNLEHSCSMLKFTLCSMLGLNLTHLQPLPRPNVARQAAHSQGWHQQFQALKPSGEALAELISPPEMVHTVLHSLHSTVKDMRGKAQHGPIADRPSTWLLLTLLQLQCIFLCPPFDASHVQLHSRLGNSTYL